MKIDFASIVDAELINILPVNFAPLTDMVTVRISRSSCMGNSPFCAGDRKSDAGRHHKTMEKVSDHGISFLEMLCGSIRPSKRRF